MSTPADYLQQELLPALFDRLDQAFPEFGWRRRSSGWIASNDTFTHQQFGCRADRIVCRKLKGGELPAGFVVGGEDECRHWTKYVNGGVKPTGEEFFDVLRILAQKVGISPLPDTPERREQVAARERRRSLFEDFWALVLEADGPAKEFAATRGAPFAELGYLASAREVATALGARGHGQTALLALGILRRSDTDGKVYAASSWDKRIVGKVRDHRGDLQGFFLRATDPEAKAKYLYSTGLDWSQVIVSGASRVGKKVTLVEGILEPALMAVHGIEVYAVGGTGSKLSAERWQELESLGIKTVVLAMDKDEAGEKGTRAALNRLYESGAKIDPFVCGFGLGEKDLAEVLTRKPDGIERVRQLIDKAVHALSFQAQSIALDARGPGPWTTQSIAAAVRAGEAFAASLPKSEHVGLRLYFWPTMAEFVPGFANVQQDVRKKIERERLQKDFREVAGKSLNAIKEAIEGSKPREVIDCIEEARVNLSSHTALPPVRRSLADIFREREQHLNRTYRGAEEQMIGPPQREMPALDEATCGLRGLILLVAAPNIGKTSIGVQWGIDTVRSNLDACFVMLSLEMNIDEMVDRIICNLSGLDWRTYIFGSQRGNRERPFTPFEQARIDNAKALFMGVAHRVRMISKSDMPEPTAETVRKEIEEFKDESGTTRCFLLVDYLQKWPIPKHIRDSRTGLEVEQWRINEMADLKTRAEDPVVVISARRKSTSSDGSGWQNNLDDAMGAAANTYDASMAMFIRHADDEELRDWWNENLPGGDQVPEAKTAAALRGVMMSYKKRMKNAGISYLKLEISKGRDGVRQESLKVTYYFENSKFIDGWKWDSKLDWEPGKPEPRKEEPRYA